MLHRRVISDVVTIPTTLFSWTIGILWIFLIFISSANSQIESSGLRDMRGDDMTSDTLDDMGLLLSDTNITISLSAIFLAASVTAAECSIVITSSFIMSLAKYSSMSFLHERSIKSGF